jgi:dTDP-glucose pyrophosphorylase
MCEPALVVLAAGMGSRYGGLKQIDPVGPGGQIIIDYSIYDAYRAGFRKVVFLIRDWMREDFEQIIGGKVAQRMEVAYAYQEQERFLPPDFSIPEGREKPWGTAHAVLCCRDAVDGPFAMINADDYYGPSAFRDMYAALKQADCGAFPMDFSMVGYILGNTLTDNGKVARGVCRTAGDRLLSIVEQKYVVKTPEGPKFSLDDGKTFSSLPADSTVSMNFWGFTPAIFGELEKRFPRFLGADLPKNPKTEEMYIPNVVGDLLREGLATVKVMHSGDKWYGVTYKADKPDVERAVAGFISSGLYPERLWE